MKQSRLAAIAVLGAASALSLTACGEAVDADAAPNPAQIDMNATDFERDEIAIGPEGDGDADPADCNAVLAEPFIGQTVDFEVRSELLETVAPLVNVRWLSPADREELGDDADREMQRRTVELDESETVTAVYCG